MGHDITWYDILGVLPGASATQIRDHYDAKAGLLRPELLAGASSTVLTAASRAQRILDAALRELGDPADRERSGEAEARRRSSGGLAPPQNYPSEPGSGSSDFDFSGIAGAAEVLGGLMAVADWLAPHPRRPSRLPVPDVRGLFYSAALEVAGRLGFRLTAVRLTEHPMAVDGLIVNQSPLPPAKLHRAGALTVHVWHPPARLRPVSGGLGLPCLVWRAETAPLSSGAGRRFRRRRARRLAGWRARPASLRGRPGRCR